MKEHRAYSFGFRLGLALILGLSILPAAMLAADVPPPV
jgi:hypothetical protein